MVVVLVLAVGFVGFRVLKANKSNPQTSATTPSPTDTSKSVISLFPKASDFGVEPSSTTTPSITSSGSGSEKEFKPDTAQAKKTVTTNFTMFAYTPDWYEYTSTDGSASYRIPEGFVLYDNGDSSLFSYDTKLTTVPGRLAAIAPLDMLPENADKTYFIYISTVTNVANGAALEGMCDTAKADNYLLQNGLKGLRQVIVTPFDSYYPKDTKSYRYCFKGPKTQLLILYDVLPGMDDLSSLIEQGLEYLKFN